MSAKLTQDIAGKVLTVGIEYNPPMGGVASVEYAYSRMFRPFNFIPSVRRNGNAFTKFFFGIGQASKLMWRLMRDRDIRIVHINTASYASFWRKSMFMFVAKMMGRKVVLHIHSGAFDRFAMRHNVLVPRLVRKADAVVVLSEYWKERIGSICHPSDIRIVPNVTEEPEYAPQKHDTFSLVFLGKICDDKGIFDLLQALAENKDRFRGRMMLHIGGDGETARAERFIRDNNLQNIACFEGWVDNGKKAALFNSADCLILPSYYEGIPICILEGMSYRLPVIATEVGGIPEIVTSGETGILVKPGDKQAIVEAIDRLIDNRDEARRMGAKGYERMRCHLPENVANSLVELYTSLL